MIWKIYGTELNNTLSFLHARFRLLADGLQKSTLFFAFRRPPTASSLHSWPQTDASNIHSTTSSSSYNRAFWRGAAELGEVTWIIASRVLIVITFSRRRIKTWLRLNLYFSNYNILQLIKLVNQNHRDK